MSWVHAAHIPWPYRAQGSRVAQLQLSVSLLHDNAADDRKLLMELAKVVRGIATNVQANAARVTRLDGTLGASGGLAASCAACAPPTAAVAVGSSAAAGGAGASSAPLQPSQAGPLVALQEGLQRIGHSISDSISDAATIAPARGRSGTAARSDGKKAHSIDLRPQPSLEA